MEMSPNKLTIFICLVGACVVASILYLHAYEITRTGFTKTSPFNELIAKQLLTKRLEDGKDKIEDLWISLKLQSEQLSKNIPRLYEYLNNFTEDAKLLQLHLDKIKLENETLFKEQQISNSTSHMWTNQHIPATDDEAKLPTILILTPVKNAAHHFENYFKLVKGLDYPKALISFGFLDGDSDDHPTNEDMDKVKLIAENNQEVANYLNSGQFRLTGTFVKLLSYIPTLINDGYAAYRLSQKNFHYQLKEYRHNSGSQEQRRSIMAKSRNYLLSSALRKEMYTLWIDVDVTDYKSDTLKKLVSAEKQIVVPNCVMGPSEQNRNYDLNSWRSSELTGSSTVEEIKHFFDNTIGDRLDLEGYSKNNHLYINHLKGEGQVVRVDAVGGAMLLVDADLFRLGLIFPSFIYRHRIETEGLSMMALDMGILSYAMPEVYILHN